MSADRLEALERLAQRWVEFASEAYGAMERLSDRISALEAVQIATIRDLSPEMRADIKDAAGRAIVGLPRHTHLAALVEELTSFHVVDEANGSEVCLGTLVH